MPDADYWRDRLLEHVNSGGKLICSSPRALTIGYRREVLNIKPGRNAEVVPIPHPNIVIREVDIQEWIKNDPTGCVNESEAEFVRQNGYKFYELSID